MGWDGGVIDGVFFWQAIIALGVWGITNTTPQLGSCWVVCGGAKSMGNHKSRETGNEGSLDCLQLWGTTAYTGKEIHIVVPQGQQ